MNRIEVRQSPRDARWFTVGDITLCCYCRRAIQLRRVRIRGVGWCDLWVHFPGKRDYRFGAHFAQPVLSWSEGVELREPDNRHSILDELIGNIMARQPRTMRTVYLPGDEAKARL